MTNFSKGISRGLPVNLQLSLKTENHAVYEFLKETWCSEPEAHKYVVLACLVLTYLKEVPMHPKDKVQYRTVGHDGIKEYFCPAKTDGLICGFCVAKKLQ